MWTKGSPCEKVKEKMKRLDADVENPHPQRNLAKNLQVSQ